jgi:hypothetical protein
VALDQAVVAYACAAAIHIGALETAAVTAQSATRGALVTQHVAVVAAGGAAFLEAKAFGATVVFAHSAAVVQVVKGGVAAVVFAAEVAVGAPEALARFTRFTHFVATTAHG